MTLPKWLDNFHVSESEANDIADKIITALRGIPGYVLPSDNAIGGSVETQYAQVAINGGLGSINYEVPVLGPLHTHMRILHMSFSPAGPNLADLAGWTIYRDTKALTTERNTVANNQYARVRLLGAENGIILSQGDVLYFSRYEDGASLCTGTVYITYMEM